MSSDRGQCVQKLATSLCNAENRGTRCLMKVDVNWIDRCINPTVNVRMYERNKEVEVDELGGQGSINDVSFGFSRKRYNLILTAEAQQVL